MDKEIQALRDGGGTGIDASVIILYDAEGNAASAEFCRGFRDNFGLTAMRVLYDPTLATAPYGDKETSIISNEHGEIIAEHHTDAFEAIVEQITNELADVPTP